MWRKILARHSLSNTFEIVIKLEFGQSLAGSSNGRPGLFSIGVTLANLKEEGKVPV